MNDKIVQIAKQKLTKRRYAINTQKVYLAYINMFVYLQDKRYKDFNSQDFNDFLINYPYTSRSQQDQVISALKFFYHSVLGKEYAKVDFERPIKERPLPKVVDGSVLNFKLQRIKNLKHRAILSLAYDTGMRASELLNLKLGHCDKHRRRFAVVNSKRGKTRELPMSFEIQFLLREYYKLYQPKEYLFNGQDNLQYSYTSLKNISNKYLHVNPNIIRHTYASELLRIGVNTRAIQRLLGHGSIKTTEIYTHIVNRDLDDIPSLLLAA